MSRRWDLTGKTVVITGGASGIGHAIARCVLRRGAIPTIIDLVPDRVTAVVQELCDSGAGKAHGVAADVTDLSAVESAVEQLVDMVGGIDVLVAGAGIGPVPTTVDAGDREHQRRVLDVNLHGVWHTVWAAAPYVRDRRGHVLIISSAAAFLPGPGWAAYAAGKAGVEQLARAMRVELAPCRTTVGVAHFGFVDTPLMQAAFDDDPLGAQITAAAPSITTRRVSPDAVAQVVVRDIERRAARTIYPRMWRPVYALRGMAGPIADAVIVRSPRMRRLMGEIRERDRDRDRVLVRKERL